MKLNKEVYFSKVCLIAFLGLLAGVAHAGQRHVDLMCSQATFSSIEASLEKRPVPNPTDNELQLAAYKGDPHGVKVAATELKALSKTSKDNTNYQESLQSAFLAASWVGHPKVVKELIGMGVNANGEPNSRLGLPIFAAAQCGHIDVLKVLVQSGADINKRALNPDQEDVPTSAIEVAIVSGENKSITWLLNHGSDVCGKTENERIVRLIQIPNLRKNLSPNNITRLDCP